MISSTPPALDFQREIKCANQDCLASIEEFVLSRDGFYVCPRCGTVDPGWRDYKSAPLYDRNPTDYTVLHRPPKVVLATVYRNGIPLREVRTSYNGQGTKGRYRPIFHWNERIAQLQMEDPPIPLEVQTRIVNALIAKSECSSGDIGRAAGTASVKDERRREEWALENLTRASIVTLLRELNLNCYRERWKSILASLNPLFKPVIADGALLRDAEYWHRRILVEFCRLRSEMPKSTIRKNGKLIVKDRHNVLPFNYEFRKIMEMLGNYDFHMELPLLRSAQKLVALDDITEKIFDNLGLPFTRTAIIKRPKIRRSRRKTKPQ